MKFDPIIVSLLDTDFYKFTMNQVYLHKLSNLRGRYYFKCRNSNIVFTDAMVKEIKEQISHLCTLHFTDEEINYLHGIRFLSYDYVEFLRLWHPIQDYVDISLDTDGHLHIIVDGPLFSVMQFEIYILEIVNEVYFRSQYNYGELVKEADERLANKINKFITGEYTFKFADFGCRRRLSREWQEHALTLLKMLVPNMVGTSNVYFAMKFSLKPIGTMAHEYVEAFQGIADYPIAYCNKYALKTWYEEYHGDLGTYLTDTIGTDVFLLDFDKQYAATYDGVRHDSGNPYEWGEKIIAHYEKLGIDPKTKTLLFSDSLNFDKAQEIYNYFKDRIKVSFGIGTFIMNDCGVEPLNIVIKLQYVNNRPVAKLSDVDGKTMTQDEEYVNYLHEAVGFRLKREV